MILNHRRCARRQYRRQRAALTNYCAAAIGDRNTRLLPEAGGRSSL